MPDHSKHTILAVDDNPAGRYALSRTLAQAGFEVAEACTGAEALRLARALPDLVLLDVHLPDLLGFEVCRTLKQDATTRSIPVVMHSSTFQDTEYRTKGLMVGADAYITHPIPADELIANVVAVLRIRDAEREAQAKNAELIRVDNELKAAKAELEIRVQERTRELEAEARMRREIESKFRSLSARLLEGRDEERRRVARELHDSAGQTLAALKMIISSLHRRIEGKDEGNLPLLEDAGILVDQAITEIRTTSHLLHPPLLDEIGFASAARWYVEGFEKRSGIKVELEMPHCERLSRDVELVLFRGLQESLTNVLRHSDASAARVILDQNNGVVSLKVRDFGKGIPQDRLDEIRSAVGSVGVGLAGMRERVKQFKGSLEVRSDPTGTVVSITVPIVDSSNTDS